MDKLSSAPVYRTAAILAAFSQASAGSDEPIRAEGTAARIPREPFDLARSWEVVAHAVVAALSRRAGNLGHGAVRPHEPGTGLTISDAAKGPLSDERPSPLVSHFAFSTEGQAWDDEPETRAA